ncbi:MAG: DUF1801 domain-containing protein [Propionicimonas sp.]
MGVFSDLVAGTDGDTRAALQQVLDRALAIVPDAVEDLSYGTPALRHRGRPLVGVRVGATHLSLFPFSPEVVTAVAPELAGFSLSKGTIRFTGEHPLPVEVLDRIIRLRAAEIEQKG